MNTSVINTRSKNIDSINLNRSSRVKSQKSKSFSCDTITSEEALIKLQSLLPGDAFLIRYWCICGLPGASSAIQYLSTRSLSDGEYIQGQFIKWIREDMTEYLILELPGCGRLQFKYGDVYLMILNRKIIIGNLDLLQDENWSLQPNNNVEANFKDVKQENMFKNPFNMQYKRQKTN